MLVLPKGDQKNKEVKTKPTVKTLLPQKQADVQLIRVAAYCRVSGDSTEQKESFATQVEYYTGLIGGNPFWSLADIYAEI